jgi:excisionase family DNA binding protein
MSIESLPTQLALLKPSEVAAQLGVSRSWLYDAAKTGRIPSIRIGGEDGPLRFVPEDLALWLDQARAAWAPGRPTVATRSAAELDVHRPAPRRRRQRASSSGQQSLL